ncbi:MAG: heavy metal translocating P-type ATPase, partial [Thermomicrobium sp.]
MLSPKEWVDCRVVLEALVSTPNIAAVTYDPQRSQLVIRFRPVAEREAVRATAVRAAEILGQHQQALTTHPCAHCDNGQQPVEVANGLGPREELLTLVVPVKRSHDTRSAAEEERVLWWRQHGLLLSTAATALLLLAAWSA